MKDHGKRSLWQEFWFWNYLSGEFDMVNPAQSNQKMCKRKHVTLKYAGFSFEDV